MTIDVTTYIAERLLRNDILANLSHDGVEAIIDWYNSINENIKFDQSLFWCWHRYSSALEAVNDFDSSVVKEIVNDLKEGLENNEHVEEDDVEMECKNWLVERTSVIELGCGDILVNTEF
ncbi:MAG: hypothetical protein IJ341_12795 [Bacteroidales bacterium]|nr:hypothetical protein [Bacteroidales bacterium]